VQHITVDGELWSPTMKMMHQLLRYQLLQYQLLRRCTMFPNTEPHCWAPNAWHFVPGSPIHATILYRYITCLTLPIHITFQKICNLPARVLITSHHSTQNSQQLLDSPQCPAPCHAKLSPLAPQSSAPVWTHHWYYQLYMYRRVKAGKHVQFLCMKELPFQWLNIVHGTV
jgi:hypothetical protein